MRQAAASLAFQLLLSALLTVILAAVLARAIAFFRLEYAGTKARYPTTWSTAQCRALEHFRLLLGIALLLLWGTFILLAPSISAYWPFGSWESVLLLVLLLLSHSWMLLLKSRNWERAFSPSFPLTICFLVFWWASMFGAAGWMFAKAFTSPSRLVVPIGVFAVMEASDRHSRTI